MWFFWYNVILWICECEYSNMLEFFQYILAKSKEHSSTTLFWHVQNTHWHSWCGKKIEYYLIDPNISIH